MSDVSQYIGSIHYSILQRKSRCRDIVEKAFSRARQEIVNSSKKDKLEISLRKLRTFRVILCQDFISDLLAEVQTDAMKYQLLVNCD